MKLSQNNQLLWDSRQNHRIEQDLYIRLSIPCSTPESIHTQVLFTKVPKFKSISHSEVQFPASQFINDMCAVKLGVWPPKSLCLTPLSHKHDFFKNWSSELRAEPSPAFHC